MTSQNASADVWHLARLQQGAYNWFNDNAAADSSLAADKLEIGENTCCAVWRSRPDPRTAIGMGPKKYRELGSLPATMLLQLLKSTER
jgi:hypothetical protein